MKKLTVLLIAPFMSCTLFTPSSLKLTNSSPYTIHARIKDDSRKVAVNAGESEYFLQYPCTTSLTIEDENGLFKESYSITIGYLESLEVTYSD